MSPRGPGGERCGQDPRRNPSPPRIRPVPDPRLSRSFEYGNAILESFSREHQALGIAELADIVGISRSTTHRYAITLVALGFLEQDSKRKYRLSTRAAGPGMAAIGRIREQVRAGVALEELRDVVGYTVSMGVLDGSRVIYVYRLFGHRPGQYVIDMDLGVGANVPMYCTALGKIMLASLSDPERREVLAGLDLVSCGPGSITAMSKLVWELDRISVREAVVSDEELVRGARSIAALVQRPLNEHPLAIEVTVPSTVYTADQLARAIGPHLKRTARLVAGH